MKKFICGILVSAMILCTIVTGCASTPPAEQTAAKGVGAVLSADSHKLTREQRLADYDAMWKEIDENYPLMGVAKRITGKNFEKIRADYRTKAADADSDKAFFDAVYGCMNEFQGTGHICAFSKDFYSEILSIYKNARSNAHCNYLYRIANNPASRFFYQYKDTNTFAAVKEKASQNGGSGNLAIKILQPGKTAYLGIKSFASEFKDVDAPKLQDFFQQIKNYQNCIIDIRGNGGGDTNYWTDQIVRPNLNKDVPLTDYQLVQGEDAKRYLSTETQLLPISGFPKLPNTNADDLARMKYFIKNQYTFQGGGPDPLYHGKFYLLTDGKVYSSSEGFATFCKRSGFAKIVGEATGGDGVGIDPFLYVLPNSGILLRFSAALGLNPDGGSNEEFGTQPDLSCTPGKDALQTCIDFIDKGKSA